MRRFEFIEHTADLAVRAYGDNIEEAFASAADALFHVITDGASITPDSKIEIEVESIDRAGLLVGFLSELILLFETERVVGGQFDVCLLSSNRLKATVAVEPFDEVRHGQGGGLHVKAVSYHMLKIVDGADGDESYVQVLFDV